MSFNVQNILATLNKSGVSKNSHFEVEISGLGDTEDEREMMYRASAAELPGRTILTTDHKFTNYGPINKVAYGSAYGEVGVTILMSEDLREKEYFEYWQNKMVNTGAFEVGGSDISKAEGNKSRFNTKYFDDYTGTVTIRTYGSAGELRSIHKLVDAYPIQLNPVPVSWGEDSVSQLSISFAYRYYIAVFEKQDQPGLGFGFSFKLTKDGIDAAFRQPDIGSIATSAIGAVAGSVNIPSKVATIRNSIGL